MLFSINAYKYLLGLDETYRLSKDSSWNQQSDFKSFNPDTDMLFPSYSAADSWLKSNNPISVNGEVIDLNEKISDLFDNKSEIEIIAHRITKPLNPIFTREQLSNVLLNGNDTYTNSLVIDYDGYPKLIPWVSRAHIKEYPVRFENFQAGNGYVGSHGSLNHIESTYLALLEEWGLHLETGRSLYRDFDSVQQSEEQIKTKIMETVNNLK
ncbi:hypothetical protein [Solibacillus sp. NPDC093137]|uniref:hypothetical protein n=1 Tax=Solibacillus sp. NPDC093137 TaxID=3390678 RepID=UPI003D0065E7